MSTSRSRSGTRIGIAAVALVLAAASSQPSADAAPRLPVAPAGNAFSGTENFVNWVYESVLFRAPDQEGFVYWTDQVQQQGVAPFVHAVVESQEWAEAWVDAFYDVMWLERHPDDAGLAYWAAFVADHRFDTFESLLGGSDEAYDVGGGHDIPYIDHVYDTAAFRAPTPDETTEGRAALTAGSRSAFVHSVLHTEDSMAYRVDIAYDVTLDRAADPDGAEYWMRYYHETGDMASMQAYLLQSPEAWDAAQSPPPTAHADDAFRR